MIKPPAQSVDDFLKYLNANHPELITAAQNNHHFKTSRLIKVNDQGIRCRLSLLKLLLKSKSCIHCNCEVETIDFKKEAAGKHFYFVALNKSNKFNIDHIWPRAAGGGDEEINLGLSCVKCNLEKDSKIFLSAVLNKEKLDPGFITYAFDKLARAPIHYEQKDLLATFNIVNIEKKLKNKLFFSLFDYHSYDFLEALSNEYKFNRVSAISSSLDFSPGCPRSIHRQKMEYDKKVMTTIKQKIKDGSIIDYVITNLNPNELLFDKVSVTQAVWETNGFKYIKELYNLGFPRIKKEKILQKILSVPSNDTIIHNFTDILEYLISIEDITHAEVLKKINSSIYHRLATCQKTESLNVLKKCFDRKTNPAYK